MKRFFVALFLGILFFTQNAIAMPIKIDNMTESDATLDEMLPNPVVYLYGVDSNGFPVLLLNFSSTIPFYGIRKSPNPWIRKRITWLKFMKLRLKLEPTANPKVCKNFYYKILKINCNGLSQKIDYTDQNTLTMDIRPTYKGAEAGSINDKLYNDAKYSSEIPIISYSGVGSDTLKIMLRRGRKFPIPNGHIDVSLVVLAVPYYTNPINYSSLRCHDYVKDFLDSKDFEGDTKVKMRTVSFGKAYSDNFLRTEYAVSPAKNAHNLIIDSQVIPGSFYDKKLQDKQFMYDDALCPHNCTTSPQN